VFASSYFDHDAFMHHALHVLDAPGGTPSEADLAVGQRGQLTRLARFGE